jgi:HEAT repeat protein
MTTPPPDIDIQPFVQSLSDDDDHIRARAAEILGKLRDPAAIPALITAMRDTRNRQKFDRGLFFQRSVQDVAIDALLDIGGAEVTAELERMVQHNDRVWQLRALKLLQTMTHRHPDQRTAIISILQSVLVEDYDLEMRTAAMEALRTIIVDS